MGFGDPDHQHPLNFHYVIEINVTCFRCELLIKHDDRCYGCARCNHFVHQVCFELPHGMRHPLHPQHSLTLLPTPGLQMDCNWCHEPCLGGYTYNCQACLKFKLHLKCFLSLNLEEKHEHPISLYELHGDDGDEVACRTCGLLIDDIDGYSFACKDCKFYIHFDCTFLPPTVKHHHVHELTFMYNYPEESDQAYCDVCEDKDGKELDRTLSYYYCKRCDYIAHVHCVTTKPAIVTTQLENFVHEHPMMYSRKPRRKMLVCACKNCSFDDYSYYFCSQCNYILHKSCAEFPQFIKHPHHKDHILSLRSRASLNMEGEQSACNFCSDKIDDGVLILQCVDCDYAEHLSCAVCLGHPYCVSDLRFSSCDDLKFRCNARGELGDGYRMSDNSRENLMWSATQYDLHLECYTLPGNIEHGCHSHPLYLISSPIKVGSDLSTMFCCDVCHTEADPNLWIYCCKQCNYIAHLKCVVSDLLSRLRTSNNYSSLCSITECKEGQFIDPVEPDKSTCSWLKSEIPIAIVYPVFNRTFLRLIGLLNGPKPIIPDVTDCEHLSIDILHCPECERPISTQAYSCMNDWVHCNVKANMITVHNQSPIHHEPLALLDEKLVNEPYCPICNQLIFPPMYSCTECQIFFHKSCAELPRKYTEDPGHTFVLLSPSMLIDSLSGCAYCKHPIKGYAYVCGSCETILDVICALGTPILKLENQKHNFFSWRKVYLNNKCEACGNQFDNDSAFFRCCNCVSYFHFECALLPHTVSHRIHQHPLVLETRLDLSVDDYVCDVCEKELNPCLWAYRCSDSCGDRATSHVSCIVTSNKKCHFKYDEECRYPLLDQLDVPLVRKMSLRAVATAIANAQPEEQRALLYENLCMLVDELEHVYAYKVTDMLLEMDQAEVLHLIESPDALKEKVVEAMEVLRISYAQQENFVEANTAAK